MASCTPDEKGSEIHIGSSSTLAVSVFSLFLGPAAQAGQVTPRLSGMSPLILPCPNLHSSYSRCDSGQECDEACDIPAHIPH